VFAIVGLSLYLSFFSIRMGPGAWLIPSEIFATGIRAKAMSMATFLLQPHCCYLDIVYFPVDCQCYRVGWVLLDDVSSRDLCRCLCVHILAFYCLKPRGAASRICRSTLQRSPVTALSWKQREKSSWSVKRVLLK
jgi:Sugar (and other) transporter